ncbi:MAG: hypothetical protein HDR71_05655 [Lachnospiraceae bacterium]|nr:hypothetical protein [Lachnospiraceae bacterium]
MLLKFKDLEEKCSSLQYVKDENVFYLQDAADKIVCEYCPKLNLDSEYDPLQYKYLFLHNEREDYSENSIFQVYIGEQRIGWIFPLQALLSNQHDYATNKFFLRYAYVASWLLLNNIKSENEKETSSEIFLEDFYDDSLTILVLDNDNISRLNESLNIEHYTVSLYQYGYSWSGRGNLDSQIEKPDKRIHLKPIAKELQQTKYIYTMFEKEIPKTREAFARFHTYYQVVEILISAVFEDKFKIFVDQLNKSVESLFDRREELGNMVLEKQRVKWLFAEYVSISQREKNILDEQCKKLLQENDKKVGSGMAENLYSVRCLLVHSMYMLSEYSQSILDDINKAFLDVIMDMLLTFKISKK